MLRLVLPGPLWECGSFVWFVSQVFIGNVVKGWLRIPRGDLYYLHEYHLFPMVYILAKRSGAKFIYDAHDFYPGVHHDADLTVFWRQVFRPFLVWLERLCLRHMFAMVTVNQGIADLYKETFGVDAAVTRNCHDPEMDVPVELGVREVLGLTEGDFLLATVGNCKPGQDVMAGIQAMVDLPSHVHLVFLGRGYDTFTEKIDAAGLGDRVHLLPPVGANQVVPYISSADAALILYYGRSQNDLHFLPNGFFQCIAARLPLLYPGLQWIRELAARYQTGVEIDPRNPESIRDGVLVLMTRMEEPQAFAENLERAAEENSWQNEEKELLELSAKALDT